MLPFSRAAVALAGVASVIFIGAACGSSSNKKVQGDLNLGPITALAGAASNDAQEMAQHAEAMTSTAAQRPDHAHWTADAEAIRADARTLSFMADSARAIASDPGAHPGGAVELMRVYGDGENLHQLGQSLVDHGTAMTEHIGVMHDEAAGDVELLKVIDAFSPNVDAMKADGQAAMDRGVQLMQDARRLATSIGIELQSGGEHDAP